LAAWYFGFIPTLHTRQSTTNIKIQVIYVFKRSDERLLVIVGRGALNMRAYLILHHAHYNIPAQVIEQLQLKYHPIDALKILNQLVPAHRLIATPAHFVFKVTRLLVKVEHISEKQIQQVVVLGAELLH